MDIKDPAGCEPRMRAIACTRGLQVPREAGRSRKRCCNRIPSADGACAVLPPGKLVTIHSLTTMAPSGHMTTRLSRAAWQNTDAKTWRVESCLVCSMPAGGRTLDAFPSCSAGSTGIVAKAPRFIPLPVLPRPGPAAAGFLLVQACLGVSIQGAQNRILFDSPYLPQGIPQLWIKGLGCGRGSVDVLVERRNDAVEVEVVDQQGEVEVVTTPSADALEIS